MDEKHKRTPKERQERLKEIMDKLEAGTKAIFDSQRFKEYLTVMSRFHKYSVNNTILIAMQMPSATYVAGFRAWQEKFGRTVKKGEKALRIVAPCPYKQKLEQQKVDPEGNEVTETVEVDRMSFREVAVFDISQTEGRELPTIANPLEGSVNHYAVFFDALKALSPVPVGFEDIRGGAKGYFSHSENRIAIQEGMSQAQTLKTLVHEIAHAKLHGGEEGRTKDRHTKEVEAEAVAYTVCQHYGLDTSDYSFGYVASWSHGRELSELRSSLETIRGAASDIISSIDAQMQERQGPVQATPQASPRELKTPECPQSPLKPRKKRVRGYER